MRRHEKPRASGIRVETPVRGKWCDLSLAQKRQHILNQLKQLGKMDEQPKITCLCGKTVPVMYAYRCFMCGAFWCPKCAGKHFGQGGAKMKIYLVGKMQHHTSGTARLLLYAITPTRQAARKYIQTYLEKHVPADSKYTDKIKQWRRRWYLSRLVIKERVVEKAK